MSLVNAIVTAIVFALLAVLACAVVHGAALPGFLCVAAWVIAVIAWIAFNVGSPFGRR